MPPRADHHTALFIRLGYRVEPHEFNILLRLKRSLRALICSHLPTPLNLSANLKRL